MKKFIIFFLIFTYGFVLQGAEKNKLDSLYSELKKKLSDTSYAQITYKIGFYYMLNGIRDSAYFRFKNSLTLSEKFGYNEYAINSSRELGFHFSEIGDIDSSIYYFKKAIGFIKKESGHYFELYSGLGNAYFFRGDFIKAYESYLVFLKLAELYGKPSIISKAYSNIGVTLKEQKKNNDALIFFNKSLEFAEKGKNAAYTYVALTNIGNVFSEKYGKSKSKYDLEMSLENYLKAQEIANKLPEEDRDLSSYILLLGNIGNTYADIKEYDKALSEYNKALKIIEKVENFENISLFYNNLASIYIDMQKKTEAKKYLDLAYKAALEISQSKDELMQNYGTASRFYELTGDYKNAYLYQYRFKELSDSLFSTETAEKRKEIELNAEYDKKDSEARAEREKKEAVEKQEKQKQLILRNAFITGFVLMLLVAFLIFRGYRLKKKSNEIITQQKEEVEKQKELVEEKQKEILDSIRYAKRIQQSLMPSEKYINRVLGENE